MPVLCGPSLENLCTRVTDILQSPLPPSFRAETTPLRKNRNADILNKCRNGKCSSILLCFLVVVIQRLIIRGRGNSSFWSRLKKTIVRNAIQTFFQKILNDRSIEWYEANFPNRYKWHTKDWEDREKTNRTDGEGWEKKGPRCEKWGKIRVAFFDGLLNALQHRG